MNDPRDYKLDLTSSASAKQQGGGASSSQPQQPDKPFLSVKFACCNVYTRIYRSPDGKTYRGRCPRCGKPVNFLVGQGGTSARFFEVS